MKSYYEYDALNYSTLLKIDSNNPGAIFKEEREDIEIGTAMLKGSLTDCLLFTPEEFNNRFIIKEEVNISPSIKVIIDSLLSIGLEYNDSNLLFVAKENNFGGSNWSDEVILKRIKTDDSREYFEQKKLNTNKYIISQEIYNQAAVIVEVLKNHEFSSYIFNSNDVRFQVPIYWEDEEFDGIKCKSLHDIIIYDHESKRIIPIDLKIKSDSKFAFINSFLRYKYYLQAAWYTRGLRNTEEYKKGYTIDNFSFLVTNFYFPNPPLLYRCSDNIMKVGEEGGIVQGEKVRGVKELVKDYIWYKETQNFDYPKYLYDTNGVIEIE